MKIWTKEIMADENDSRGGSSNDNNDPLGNENINDPVNDDDDNDDDDDDGNDNKHDNDDVPPGEQWADACSAAASGGCR